MNRTIQPTSRRRVSTRSPIRKVLVGSLAVLAVSAALLGCSSAPRAVLNVPGNYVADLWAPTLDSPNGGPDATVLLCLDEASAVLIETGDGGEGSIGGISLEWGGIVHEQYGAGDPVTLTTSVLQPGCGLLTFTVDCCHVDHYLAVKASKV